MKCDICGKTFSGILKKIIIDWDGTYKRVCPICIEERGEYMIACRIDKPREHQDDEYRKIKNKR